MSVFKTYQEAVIANGSTKGVYSDGTRFFTDGSHSKYYNTKPCNPADNDDTDTLTWEPGVGDEVSTREGVGIFLTTVVRDGTMSSIVQFENDWNEFKLDELRPVDQDYYNGKAVYELWHSCLLDEQSSSFDMLSLNGQKKWIKFAKLVKPVDSDDYECKLTRGFMEI